VRILRALVGVAGIAILVAGVVFFGGDSSAVEPAIEALGNDYLVVAIPAVLAVVLVFFGLLFRAVSGISQATPPDPEGVPTVPTFGSEFDDYVSGTPGIRSHLFGDGPNEIHDRVREAAIRTEMRVGGITREAATEAVDAGRWTDDGDAATFCQPNGASVGSLSRRVRAATRGQTWSQYGAARAADALVERSDAAARRAMLNDGGSERDGTDA
jgi:hypothetical protein